MRFLNSGCLDQRRFHPFQRAIIPSFSTRSETEIIRRSFLIRRMIEGSQSAK
jgi:hypothetical protein